MKAKTIITFLIAGMYLAACASAGNATPIAAAATNTPIPIATFTPAPTATSTPMPPSGKIMIVMNHELVVYPADPSRGTTFKNFIIPKEKFDAAFPAVGEKGGPLVSPYLSPDGTKIAVLTCRLFQYSCLNQRLYISTTDLKSQLEFTNYNGGLLAWSPASDMLLIQGNKNNLDKKIISVRAENFGAVIQLPPAEIAFWTYNGKQIYFYKDGWHIINADGTNEQSVPCDLCSMAASPSSFAAAQSPDGDHIAIGYMDGTVFIVKSNNFADFKIRSAGGYISSLFWSPDGTKIAVSVKTSANQSDIVIMNANGTVAETVARPEGVDFTIPCSWSPDSQYLTYLTIEEKGSGLYFYKLGGQASIQRLFVEASDQSCPIWVE
jgi:hypothetical protein